MVSLRFNRDSLRISSSQTAKEWILCCGNPRYAVVLTNQNEPIKKVVYPTIGYRPSAFHRSQDFIAPASQFSGRPLGEVE
jgi:hypothetical protein